MLDAHRRRGRWVALLLAYAGPARAAPETILELVRAEQSSLEAALPVAPPPLPVAPPVVPPPRPAAPPVLAVVAAPPAQRPLLEVGVAYGFTTSSDATWLRHGVRVRLAIPWRRFAALADLDLTTH